MSDRYEGFDEFVATRGPALMRTASLLTGNAAAAEDAMQEALTRVAMRWPKVLRGGPPEPYVRRVLYTVVVDDWRRRRRLDAEPAEIQDQGDGVDVSTDFQLSRARRGTTSPHTAAARSAGTALLRRPD